MCFVYADGIQMIKENPGIKDGISFSVFHLRGKPPKHQRTKNKKKQNK